MCRKAGELVIREGLDWVILLVVNEVTPGGELVIAGGLDERVVPGIGKSEREDKVVYVDLDEGGILVTEVLTDSRRLVEGKKIGVLWIDVSVWGGRTVIRED